MSSHDSREQIVSAIRAGFDCIESIKERTDLSDRAVRETVRSLVLSGVLVRTRTHSRYAPASYELSKRTARLSADNPDAPITPYVPPQRPPRRAGSMDYLAVPSRYC